MSYIESTERVISRHRPPGLFEETPPVVNSFPIQSIYIDWDRLIAKRPMVLETAVDMPSYLLKPEITALLANEYDPEQRLILDLMWSAGGRVSEILALTPASFIDDGYDFMVRLKTLKQRPGRPSKKALARSEARIVPITERILYDRIQTHLTSGRFRKTDRIFPICRQTINHRIKRLIKRVGREAPFNIGPHTFRHSFAVHLLLHGRPLKYIAQLLGHKSVESTEIYTNVLTTDGAHLLDGIEFH
jgi:site-specific recombinase XerD